MLALAAGIATTLVVGAAVTEALLPAIAFSAIVGLPVGIATGLLVGALLLVVLAGRAAHPVHRHAATAAGVCGLVVLGIFAVTVFALDAGALVGIVVSGVVGTLSGAGVFVWLRQGDSRSVHAVTSR